MTRVTGFVILLGLIAASASAAFAQKPTDFTLLILCDNRSLEEECKKIQAAVSPWWRQRVEIEKNPQAKFRLRIKEVFGNLTIYYEVVEFTIPVSGSGMAVDLEIVTIFPEQVGGKNEAGINRLIAEIKKAVENRHKGISPQRRPTTSAATSPQRDPTRGRARQPHRRRAAPAVLRRFFFLHN